MTALPSPAHRQPRSPTRGLVAAATLATSFLGGLKAFAQPLAEVPASPVGAAASEAPARSEVLYKLDYRVEEGSDAGASCPSAAETAPNAAVGTGLLKPTDAQAMAGGAAAPEAARAAGIPSAGSAPGLGASSERDSVAVEIALLDQVRAALAEGRSAAALVLLTRYRGAARTELLNPEATVLHVEALYAAGRGTEARSMALGYVNAHGSGPQAARLRRFLEATAVPE